MSPTNSTVHHVSELTEYHDLKGRHDLNPCGYRENLELGLFCARTRDLFVAAEPFLVNALSHNIIDGNTELALCTLCQIYMKSGRLDLAIQSFKILEKVNPNVITYKYLYGDALYLSGHILEASRYYREAIRNLDQNTSIISQRLGRPVPRLLARASMIHHHIGEMAHSLDLFLKARALGWVPEFEAVLLAPPEQTANSAFAECFRPHVTVLTDSSMIDEFQERFSAARHFVNYVTTPNGLTLHRDLAYGAVQRAWSDEERPPVITLPAPFQQKGRQWLRRMGVPDQSWFACLHVREAGFHREKDAPDDQNKLRNADIANYLEAIRAVTERGGWVVRMGDPTMAPLPPMERVIDYALSGFRDQAIDIFCLAQCRFFFGSAAGPMNVARAFGVPVLATDFFPAGSWPFSRGDLFIHKLCRSAEDGRVLSIGESLKPPLFGAFNPLIYMREGIEVVDNTGDEIHDAVIEFLDMLEGNRSITKEDEARLERYGQQADPYELGFVLPLAPSFLRRHPELVTDD